MITRRYRAAAPRQRAYDHPPPLRPVGVLPERAIGARARNCCVVHPLGDAGAAGLAPLRSVTPTCRYNVTR